MQARLPTCAWMPFVLVCVGCTPLHGGRFAPREGSPCSWGDVGECEEKCVDGDVVSCNKLGEMTEEGSGVLPDASKAAALYAQVCENKGWHGCANLARLYASGNGVPKDEALAASLFMSACGASVAPACANLMAAHVAGTTSVDRSGEVARVRAGCAQRDPASCRRLGSMYADGVGVPAIDRRAMGLLKQACDGGDAEACGLLGSMLHDNLPSLYDRACAGGHAPSCFTLARMLDHGWHVQVDKGRARELYGKARSANENGCEKGDSTSCRELAVVYAFGYGDVERSMALFQRACDGSPPSGCTILAEKYGSGWGVEKDPARASTLLHHACLNGDPSACSRLGQMIERSKGAAKDSTMAVQLYRRACRAGDRTGCLEVARHASNP